MVGPVSRRVGLGLGWKLATNAFKPRTFAVRIRGPARRPEPLQPERTPHPSTPGVGMFDTPPPTFTYEHSIPVKFPPRKFSDILSETGRISSVLAHPMLIINRQIEMLNVFLGMVDPSHHCTSVKLRQ